jgi:hypothetical protein
MARLVLTAWPVSSKAPKFARTALHVAELARNADDYLHGPCTGR